MNVPPLELERLLADERWLRALARRLVRDTNDADDLLQEARLAWLTAPPPSRTRSWLAGVLRHRGRTLARTRSRRAAREGAVARSAAAPATDDVVAELELSAAVGRALLALEEPCRRTLVRRFHRGETLAEIAEAEGLALASVHQRIQTGLARLREQLDRAHGGRRSAWATVALSLAESRSHLPETALMTSGSKLATVAALLLGTLGVAWWVRQDRTPNTDRAAALPLALGSANVAPALDSAPPPPAAAREAASGPRDEPVQAASTALVHGRVMLLDGSALAGVEVAFGGFANGARTDAAGEFTLPPPENEEARLELRSGRYATVVPGHRELPLVIASEFAVLEGRVLALDGTPLAAASVNLRLREQLFRDLGRIRPGWRDLESRWVARTDERGRFTLTTPIGAGLFLSGAAEGYLTGELELAPPLAPELLLERAPRDEQARASGRVLPPDGQPSAGASVSAG
ncbi:MAG: sigma-70 family RNA polymerase sigma factor, partial [Planctomycetota bacterium]